MSYPRPPGGLFPLTTAPTGRNAGGQYPLSAVLSDAIRSLAPTAYWKLDEASGNLADAMSGGYTATVTGSPTFGVAAPEPIGRGVTWSGTGQHAVSSTSVPNASASMSVLVFLSTTNSTAAARQAAVRGDTSQFSWSIQLSSGHAGQFIATQSSGSAHATATVSGAINDGAVRGLLGTFDGTTILCHRLSQAGASSASSTTLTNTWYKSSTAPIYIAGRSTSMFPGTLYHVAYWVDRVISPAEAAWLGSVAFGG